MPTSIPDWGSLVWSSCGTSTPVDPEYRNIAAETVQRAQAEELYRRQEESLRQRLLHDTWSAQDFNQVAKPIKPKDSQEVQELKDQVNHLTDLVESLFKRLESVGILKDEV